MALLTDQTIRPTFDQATKIEQTKFGEIELENWRKDPMYANISWVVEF